MWDLVRILMDLEWIIALLDWTNVRIFVYESLKDFKISHHHQCTVQRLHVWGLRMDFEMAILFHNRLF
jgi:hypothetical protein